MGTCVEPVGPEHTHEELAEMIRFTASFDPAFSGAARRISIPRSRIPKLIDSTGTVRSGMNTSNWGNWIE